MDCENAIKKLLELYNEGENKNIIIKSINLIIKENDLKNIKLIKMNNINNKFFKAALIIFQFYRHKIDSIQRWVNGNTFIKH